MTKVKGGLSWLFVMENQPGEAQVLVSFITSGIQEHYCKIICTILKFTDLAFQTLKSAQAPAHVEITGLESVVMKQIWNAWIMCCYFWKC